MPAANPTPIPVHLLCFVPGGTPSQAGGPPTRSAGGQVSHHERKEDQVDLPELGRKPNRLKPCDHPDQQCNKADRGLHRTCMPVDFSIRTTAYVKVGDDAE